MGYAETFPFLAYYIKHRGSGYVNMIGLTNANAQYGVGTVKTYDYTRPLSHAYITLVFNSVVDTSGAANYMHRHAGVSKLKLYDESLTEFDVGTIPWDYIGYTLGNGQSGKIEIPFSTDLITFMQPDHEYTANLVDVHCTANNLNFYQPHLELTLIGNI